MKTNFLAPLLLAGLTACSPKNQDATPLGTTTAPVSVTNPSQTFDPAGQTLKVQGTLVGDGRYSVKGTAKIYEKAGVQTIVFENFMADGGPDLRIYLADGVAVSNFVEVTKLTASGNFFLTIPAGYDPAKHRTALIWCKQFSVPFGHADLK